MDRRRRRVFSLWIVQCCTILFSLVVFAPAIYFGFHVIIDRDCSRFAGSDHVPIECEQTTTTTTTTTTTATSGTTTATTSTSTTEPETTTSTTTEETTTISTESTTEETTSESTSTESTTEETTTTTSGTTSTESTTEETTTAATTATTEETTPTTATTEETTTSTTATETETTTTETTVATTSPSSFSIICPPDLNGNVEDTFVLTNYSVVGTGCGGSNITVSFTDNTSMQRRGIANSKFGNNNNTATRLPRLAPVRRSMTVTSGTSVNLTIVQPELITNFSLIGNVSFSFDRPPQPGGRYIDLPNSSFIGQPFVSPTIFGGNSLVKREYLVSTAGYSGVRLSIDNSASNVIRVYAPYGSVIGILFFSSIFDSRCTIIVGTPNQYSQYKALFDAEAQRFVLIGMFNGFTCVALSATNNPSGTWTNYLFSNATMFAFTHGFSAEVWGDYYSACWNNGQSQQNCLIFERAQMLLGLTARFVFIQNFISPITGGFGLSPVVPLGQRTSPRGSLISSTAPCGVYATLDEGAQMIRYGLCSNLVFSPASVTITTKSVPVGAPGWNSGYNLPCQFFNGGSGCIPVNATETVNSLSNYIRLSYYDYGSYEGLAFTLTTDITGESTVGETNVLWGQSNVTDMLAETTVTPYVISGQGAFSSDIGLTCRNTVMLSYFGITPASLVGLSAFSTFRLSTDPVGVMRAPPTRMQTPSLSSPLDPGGNHNWGMIDLSVAGMSLPRGISVSCFDSGSRRTYNGWIQNQTTARVWSGQDACSTTESCTQNIHLGTLTACENTIET